MNGKVRRINAEHEIRKAVEEMYAKEDFIEDSRTVFTKTCGNTVEIPGIGSVTLYEMPLIGFGSADDGLFIRYKQPEIIGANYLTPKEWLPSAKTVVSFFLPFTEKVRQSNRASKTDPSLEWLYGRIEGQAFITQFMTGLKKLMDEKRIDSCVPMQDSRYGVQYETTSVNGVADFHADSRWSERHAAYACGLGTFGLTRALISEKGIAGRYASIIVSAEFQPDGRRYTGIDDYCIRCGACARKCPAHAISIENGKNNVLCKTYLLKMSEKYPPRYGCGKCQVGVPCECKAPGMQASKRRKEI